MLDPSIDVSNLLLSSCCLTINSHSDPTLPCWRVETHEHSAHTPPHAESIMMSKQTYLCIHTKDSIILVMWRSSPLSTFWITACFQDLSPLVYYTKSEPIYHLCLFCIVVTFLKTNKPKKPCTFHKSSSLLFSNANLIWPPCWPGATSCLLQQE